MRENERVKGKMETERSERGRDGVRDKDTLLESDRYREEKKGIVSERFSIPPSFSCSGCSTFSALLTPVFRRARRLTDLLHLIQHPALQLIIHPSLLRTPPPPSHFVVTFLEERMSGWE
jgi:hypothetical protein